MKERLLQLLKTDAYREGDFTLSSGKQSHHYINCKPVTLNGYGLKMASYLFMDHLDTDARAVAGLTLGADPLVSGVAMMSEMNGLIVRKKPKGHGTDAWIEGPRPPEGSVVTVLEDVITTGGSALFAVEKLRDAGYVVNRIVSIVNRQEGAEASIIAEGLELVSLFTLEDLLKNDET
jgi:orotate phosphoribosyltransferase